MAIGQIELQGQTLRTQDYTAVKHNEDNKGTVQQAYAQAQNTKQVETQHYRVNQGTQPEYHEKKFDAKEKGSNEYSGDGGRNRKKKEEDGKVILKSTGVQGKIVIAMPEIEEIELPKEEISEGAFLEENDDSD